MMSLCATSATLSSSHFLRRHVVTPSSALILFPAALSARIPIRLRRPNAVVISAAAGIDGALLQDAGATALVVGGAYALVSTFDNLTRRNIIEQNLSRKLVHIFSGLLFLASWPIFRELLKGPLYYVLVLILCAVVFWRDSPVGMISLAMMCGGDGIADIMGRRFGSAKIPYNPLKSWAGSISMFLFGFVVSISMLYYFAALGYIELDWVQTVGRVALVSFVATFVESLPTNGIVDDNVSVPVASMVTSFLVFGYKSCV
ncbi:hypothetical protein ACS0TY_000675 [Phlomoides rotata]